MIKEKLRRGSLLYKFYLYYSLFIKDKFYFKRTSYSQFKEDQTIYNFFKGKIGKYVDIGCYHPIRHNNTYLLYLSGWKGINIDINPTSIDLFNIIRKKDQNIIAAISNQSNLEKNFYFQHNWSTVNSFSKKHVEKYSNKFSTIKVNTNKFSDIVKQNFDFLNIDCEGEDLKILKSIDLKKFTPSLICVEIIDEEDKKKIFDFLEENKYRVLKICGYSYIFKKNVI